MCDIESIKKTRSTGLSPGEACLVGMCFDHREAFSECQQAVIRRRLNRKGRKESRAKGRKVVVFFAKLCETFAFFAVNFFAAYCGIRSFDWVEL
jgi:hypothetical protein